MKKILAITTLLFALISCKNSVNPFDDLQYLQGTWVQQKDSFALIEKWNYLHSDTLLGKSYAAEGKDTALLEVVHLYRNDSSIIYSVNVTEQNDGKQVNFILTKTANKTFVFENLQHDYPKRITYQFIKKDTIHASIDDGTEQGKRSNYYFTRKP